jgi:WD40 repeat protein
MARVFLSHSSHDNRAAGALKSWLDEQGFAPAFLDFDPDSGIPVGATWERTLYEKIQSCQALLILQTPNWSASRWCFAEFTQARALGKPIFQIVDSDEGADEAPIATDLQRLDLRRNREQGLAQLRRELAQIALQDQGGFPWPPPTEPSRPPFPGLMVFEAEDAPVFFGRDDDWRAVIERLNTRRVQGGPRLLVLLGSSGAGKSSLLRAGVLPRLQRAGKQWLVLPVLRPQSHPLEALAQSLALALQRPTTWEELHQQLLNAEAPEDGAPEDLVALWRKWAASLRQAAQAAEAQILLPIDQGEELFTVAEAAQKERFVAALAAALQQPLPIQIVLTIRGDAIGSLQSLSPLLNNLDPMPIGPLSLERYRQIIEGPARVAGLKTEEAFVDRAIHDTATEDALPLLAFALRQLHDRYGTDGVLSLSDYQALADPAAGLSPLENAVKQAADGVLTALQPDEGKLRALRDAFVPAMVRVSEEGSYARRAASWDALPLTARPLLEALVTARLLVRRQDGEQPSTVEVAHEALLRVWPLLRSWLDDSRDFLLGSQQLEQDLAQWQGASSADKSRALLSGLKLAKARAWLVEREHQLRPELRTFIKTSQRQASQQRQLLIGSVAVAFALISGAAGLAFLQLQRARSAQTAQFEATHRALLNSDPFLSTVYGLAAAESLLDRNKPWESARLSQSLLEASLKNQERSMAFQSNQNQITGVVELANGDLLTGGIDGTLRTWRASQLLGSPIKTGHEKIKKLIALKDGQLLLAASDGSISFWRDGKRSGKRILASKADISAVLELRNGDIITGDSEGIMRRWRNYNAAGEPVATNQGTLTSIVELRNGVIISAGSNGSIIHWRNGTRLGTEIKTGQGYIAALAELPNGDLISSGGSPRGPLGMPSKGSLKLWRDGLAIENGRAYDTGQGLVTTILVTRSGTMITGGDDGSIKRWNRLNNGIRPIPIGNAIGAITSLLRLRNGDIVSTDEGGNARRWINPDTHRPSFVIENNNPGGPIASLANGDIVTVDDSRRAMVWRDGKAAGTPLNTNQKGVTSILQTSGGAIITGGQDGTIRRWNKLEQGGGNSPALAHKHAVKWLIAGPNDSFVSSDDETIRFWHGFDSAGNGKAEKPIKLPFAFAPAFVETMVMRRDGELIVAGSDGSLSHWRNGRLLPGEKPSDTIPGRILSMVELSNRDLIIGSEFGLVQVWRKNKQLGLPFTVVVTGGIRRYLADMFLVKLPGDEWMSSISGESSENGKIRRWKESLAAGSGESISIDPEGRYIISDLLISKRGEIIFGRIGEGKSDFAILSLPSTAKSSCRLIDLNSLSASADLNVAAAAARRACKLAKP